MGSSNRQDAIKTASPQVRAPSNLSTMADLRHRASAAAPSAAAPTGPEVGALFTQADYDALVRELGSLRRQQRSALAARLREARAFGGSTENDDLLAVLEDASVDNARLAQLEELLQFASIVEGASSDGGAGLGSTVRVADETGRTNEYELIGRRRQQSARHEITMASPVGQALRGARPGDLVHVALPNRRECTLRVLDVRHSGHTTAHTSLAA
jgi:transcription elongation factor GreA